MKISIPLTGTLISYDPLMGDPDDPVRIIDIDLGNVSWELVSLDLEHDLALIEIAPADMKDSQIGIDAEGNPVYERMPLSDGEKGACLEKVKQLITGKTISELYEASKCPRLKRPV